MKFRKTNEAFLLVCTVLLFQIIRNISLIGYTGILFLSYAVLYLIYFNESKKNFGHIFFERVRGAKLMFLVTYFLIPVITLFDIDYFMVAFPRFFVTFPFVLFCFICPILDENNFRSVKKILVIFSTLAAFSLVIQIFTGPISFFADSSIREGLDRYSTLAGSLTVFGTTGAIAILFLLFDKKLFNNFPRIFNIIAISIGLLASLQKSAIINLVIIFFIAIVLVPKKIKIHLKFRSIIIFIFLMFSLSVFFLLYGERFNNSVIAQYINTTINYTFTNSTTVGVSDDLYSRLFERPLRVISFHNISGSDFLFGIGLKALGGTMGLSFLPMAHNNYFDLLLSGGIIHLTSFLIIVSKSLHNMFFIQKKNDETIALTLLLVNMFIGAGNFYQPQICVILFSLLFLQKEHNDY